MRILLVWVFVMAACGFAKHRIRDIEWTDYIGIGCLSIALLLIGSWRDKE